MATSDAPRARPSLDEILDDLRGQVAELSGGALSRDAIDPSGHIFDHGYIDSLSAVSFLAHIEDHYGVCIEDVALVGSLRTLNDIAQYVQENA